MSNVEAFAPINDFGVGDALQDWRWLVGPDPKPQLLTAMGDVFAVKPGWFGSGSVYFLDTHAGEFRKIARTWKQFKRRMTTPDEEASRWLKYGLLRAVESEVGQLEQGHCYSPKIPPILGGNYEPANFEATPWRVHLSLSGQIHEQVKRLPEGTPISGVTLREGSAA